MSHCHTDHCYCLGSPKMKCRALKIHFPHFAFCQLRAISKICRTIVEPLCCYSFILTFAVEKTDEVIRNEKCICSEVDWFWKTITTFHSVPLHFCFFMFLALHFSLSCSSQLFNQSIFDLGILPVHAAASVFSWSFTLKSLKHLR